MPIVRCSTLPRAASLCAAAGLLAAILAAQPSATLQKARSNRLPSPDDELVAIAELAGGLTPEFAADGLLRLVESGKLRDREWKLELIDRAFARAQLALQLYPKKPVPIGFTDQPGAMVGIASRAQLDRMSLCIRAVREALPLDPALARDMFEKTGFPDVKESKCEDRVVPDLESWFETLRLAGEQGFPSTSAGQRKAEEFVVDSVRRISSPSAAFAAASALARLKTRPASFQRIVLAFSSAVSVVEPNDRLFSVELFYEPSRQQMRSLLDRCHTGDCDYGVLLAGVASFYRKNLNAPRCEDTFKDEVHRQNREEALSNLNVRLLSLGQRESIATEPGPEKLRLETVKQPMDFFNIPEYARLMRRVQGMSSLAAADLEESLRSQLEDLRRWEKPDEMTERDFFLMKSEIFGAAARNALGSNSAPAVISAYLSFLNLSEAHRQDYPTEWLWRIKQLISGPFRLRGQPDKLVPWKDSVAAEMERSPNPVIYLYGRLQRTVGLKD
jgi:hypothetical protein